MILGLLSDPVAAGTYVVKKGDVLSRIAASHVNGKVWGKGGSLDKILSLNHQIKNEDLIYPNRTIELGDSHQEISSSNSSSNSSSKNENKSYYVVKEGETLSQIAHKHIQGDVWGDKGTLKLVLHRNHKIKESDLIFPGERILIESHSSKRNLASSMNDDESNSNEEDDESSDANEEIQNSTGAVSENSELMQSNTPTLLKEKLWPVHFITPSAQYSFTSLQATDPTTNTQANLNTAYNVNLGGTWTQKWSPSFSTDINYNLSVLSFQPSTNPTKTLSNSNQLLSHINVGATHSFGNNFRLKYYLAYGQELFLHGMSTSNISIDAVPMGSLGTQLSYQVYSFGNTSTGFEAAGSILSPAKTDSYTVAFGYNFAGDVYLLKSAKTNGAPQLKASLGYAQRNQNTSIINLSESTIFASFNYFIPISSMPDLSEK